MIKLDPRTYQKCWSALDFSDLGRLFRSSMLPGGSWWFMVVPGCFWWFLVLCCLAEPRCIPTFWFQDAHEINETSGIYKKLINCWFLVVTGCFWWFLVVLGRLCRSSTQMIQLDHRTYQKLARVGLQRNGALVQIVDANDPTRPSNVPKVLARG